MEENNSEKKENKKNGLIDFLKEYSVIGMAIGVIIAQTSTNMVNSIVKGLFTPFINLLIPGDRLQALVFKIGKSQFDIGSIIDSALTFFIVMVLLYVIVKKLLKRDELLQKK